MILGGVIVLQNCWKMYSWEVNYHFIHIFVTLPFPRFEKIKIIIQLKLQLMHIIWLFNSLWNKSFYNVITNAFYCDLLFWLLSTLHLKKTIHIYFLHQNLESFIFVIFFLQKLSPESFPPFPFFHSHSISLSLFLFLTLSLSIPLNMFTWILTHVSWSVQKYQLTFFQNFNILNSMQFWARAIVLLDITYVRTSINDVTV